MEDDRNKVVTEGRFALTLLICLLVAIGYVVLSKLVAPSESTTIELVAPSPPHVEEPHEETEPLVLKIDGGEPAHMTKRPRETSPSPATNGGVLPANSTDELQRR